MIRIWVDDVRPAPQGYQRIQTVNDAINAIRSYMIKWQTSGHKDDYRIDEISLDHDAGDFAKHGGDYIKILDWMEEHQNEMPYIPTFNIHSMNIVGVKNMRRIIQKNGWKEVV